MAQRQLLRPGPGCVWVAICGGVIGACLIAAPRPAIAQALLDPSTLTKYVDMLPNPLANPIAPAGVLDGAPYYEVSIGQFTQKLHRDLAPTTLWGYNNSYPGPLFDVEAGQTIKVKWTNNLVDGAGQPLDHLLPYDTTLHGAGGGMHGMGSSVPQARTVTHLHGGITPSGSDGYPEHWFSADASAAPNGLGGPAGNSFTTTYPNAQRAAGLWYHDHSMAITRLNVYAGMAGFYLIRDAQEAALNLPSGAYEVPMVFQDRSFREDGSLFYPSGPDDMGAAGHQHGSSSLPDDFPSDASQVPHFHGNTNLVNGVVWPLMEVEPRKYRFRMLNGANARFYDLRLEDAAQNAVTFHQIGTDVGFLENRVDRTSLLLAPADRADVIVDFSQYAPGTELMLRNLGPDGPYGLNAGPAANPNTTGQVMKFRIKPLTGPDTTSLPAALPAIERLDPEDSVITRTLMLNQTIDEYGRPKLLLNNEPWADAVSEVVKLGDVEIWEFQNQTQDSHPMHLHLGHFQVLERYNRQTHESIPIPEQDQSWEDTITVNPRENVKIIVRFDQYAGRYVWHCHVLEHEDYDMMRPFSVLPALPGDFDEDGDVDAADLAQWQGDFGAYGDSDVDGDGDSDGADFLAWQRNVGVTPAGAVPEPGGAALAIVVVAALFSRQHSLSPRSLAGGLVAHHVKPVPTITP
jgi:spore coat protein A